MPGGPPGGGFPGGGPPGGGFPGAGLPGGGFPQSLPRPTISQPQPQPQTPTQQTAPASPQNQVQGPPPTESNTSPPSSAQPSGPAIPGQGSQPSTLTNPTPGSTGSQRLEEQVQLSTAPRPVPGRHPNAPAANADPASHSQSLRSPESSDTAPSDTPSAVPNARVADGSPSFNTTDQTSSPKGGDGAASAPLGRPVPIVRPQASLFGLAPAPFVEGDFIAGVRLSNGQWALVSPHAEGFPNAWQRRVALWFLLSLLTVAPVAWLFARRIVGPLNDFAHAADVLGRDPSAAVLPLHGPAEIGRAAHAFNQMQSRLRSFVDDRTAMIGAISHDLRTPLTRLRFRIEEVPEDQQEDLRGEVAEMEEMISSVIAFMRDASIPNARERRDLAELVDDVIEDATLLGDVQAERVESAIVDVDPLGVRRVLNNLLTNAMKYGGGHVRVRLSVENDCAMADIVDDGPGVPDAELERIFEPFYRSEAARASDREGSGLGLAVCRSIARAHGGDVALFRSPEGFTARVTLPLAFDVGRRLA
nr:ATP-binding protein [Sphingomonas sp. GC_Shp_3]